MKKRIYFYRYGSIVEPALSGAFTACRYEITEEAREVKEKTIPGEERIAIIGKALLTAVHEGRPYDFVFTVNFFPYISDICERLGIPYVSISVDCPVMELYSTAIRNSCNRVFLFDYAQYEGLKRENPNGIFYLPLAADVEYFDRILAGSKPEYRYDISMVGSLYIEKSPLHEMLQTGELSDYEKGYLYALMDAQEKVYGMNLIEESLPDSLVQSIKRAAKAQEKCGRAVRPYPEMEDLVANMDSYVASHFYVGHEIAARERIHTLTELGERFDTHLFTGSRYVFPKKAAKLQTHSAVATLTEMPKVFRQSKINLNITMRPIQTGLSQRVWDVLGCGGFLMSNYQMEIPEYFIPGKELVLYESRKDLTEKCAYYLEHEEERQAIARAGYYKVKEHHSWKQRIQTIVEMME